MARNEPMALNKSLQWYETAGSCAGALTEAGKQAEADEVTADVGDWLSRLDDEDRAAAEAAYDRGYQAGANAQRAKELRADQEAGALVKAMAERFPELNLSFGYIGNLERTRDDRCWRVFTNRRDDLGRSLSFGYASTETLPALAERLKTPAFAEFCERAMTKERA